LDQNKTTGEKIMNCTLTDVNKKTFLHCSIIAKEENNSKKTCICSFSWNNEEEAEKRLQSTEVVIMASRPIDEDETQILQSAWVTVGKDYYKDLHNMPKEIEELDIQFNCVLIRN
jgi:hypothetical protein